MLPADFVRKMPPPFQGNEEDMALMRDSVSYLKEIGAIRQCVHSHEEIVSPIFLVPKSNGSKRFVLNLKRLNFYCPTSHFQMEDSRTAAKLLSKDCFMGKIDMKDAYLTIPLHPSSKKFFRFYFEGILYEFEVVPFGFNDAPRIFTKILRPVASYLRSKCLLLVFYLDDIFCLGSSYDECYFNLEYTSKFLKSLGWIINLEKCELIPSKSCIFLGFLFNSERLTMELPLEKKHKIL